MSQAIEPQLTSYIGSSISPSLGFSYWCHTIITDISTSIVLKLDKVHKIGKGFNTGM